MNEENSNFEQWQPNEGPQTEVLMRSEFEIGYGGARGGGKTEAGLAWLLYDTDNPRYRALVIRKNSKDLSDWLDRAQRFYRSLGVARKGSDLYFPSGAVIRTGHLKDDNAYGKYQGHEYHRMLIEELTQIASEDNYLKLLSSCRSTVPELVPQVFSSFNPDGAGFFWVRKRFNIKGIPTKPIETVDSKTGLSRVFIPSRLSDNPALFKDGMYRAFLEGLPDGLREAWKDGSWNDPVIKGAYYTREIQQARKDGRIGYFPLIPDLPVHTIWDLGLDDSMTILFVQKTAKKVRLVDSYTNNNFGLPHYKEVLDDRAKTKGYRYGTHYAPHDVNKRELSTGKTILDTAHDVIGIDFEAVPMVGISDGIEKVRLMWPRIEINEETNEQSLNAFLNYRKEWDEEKLKFKDSPEHDWSSHFADALRYLAVVEDDITNEEEVDTYQQPDYEASSMSAINLPKKNDPISKLEKSIHRKREDDDEDEGDSSFEQPDWETPQSHE